jgi:hypothetical protein
MPWIYRPWDERDDRHGIWAWGPNADETADVRGVLKWWSSRWAGQRPAVQLAAVRGAAPDAELCASDLHLVAPYTEGTWEALAPDRWRVSVFPWALAEGCAHDGEEAWAEYVLLAPRGDAPRSLEVTRIGAPRPGADGLGIDVAIDGIGVGTFDGARRFRPAEEGALADAFATDSRLRWLRLSTRSPVGAAVIRRFTAELPSGDADDELVLTFGY